MNSQKHILVTGGLGFIGSHTCVELLEAGYKVTVVDNLSNCYETVKDKIEKITGKTLTFVYGDLTEEEAIYNHLDDLFVANKFNAVMHFAGLKAVGESVENPLRYYDTNLRSTMYLIYLMQRHKVYHLIFSSSATVYGNTRSPIPESSPLTATNPYGRTKLTIEYILKDLINGKNGEKWKIVILRYFNPVGAHPSGLIGESPRDIPNNLMPYIMQVANEAREQLHVFGMDYNTPDGTGIRDYIHVVDVAKGHIKALEYAFGMRYNIDVFNLGTGKGVSVLEMVEAVKKASGKPIPIKVIGRRAGDVAICFADPSKAENILEWKATKTLEEMAKDTWNFIELNYV